MSFREVAEDVREIANDVWVFGVLSWAMPVYIIGGFAMMVYAERLRERVKRT